MNPMKKALPFVLLAVSLLVVVWVYLGNAKTLGAQPGFDYDALAKTKVMDDGRAKPLDSVARNTLLTLYSKQRLKHEGKKIDAIVWLMDVIARPKVAHNYKVFRVDHPDVIQLMGLSREEAFDDKYFSYNQLLKGREKLYGKVRAMGQDDPKNAEERAARQLVSQMSLYEQLLAGQRPLVVPRQPGVEGSTWQPFKIGPALGPIGGLEREILMLQGVSELAQKYNLAPGEVFDKAVELAKQGQAPETFVQYAAFYDATLTDPEGYAAQTEESAALAEDPERFKKQRAFLLEQAKRLSKDPSIWSLMEGLDREPINPGSADAAWFDLVMAYRNQQPERFNAALKQRAELVEAAEVKEADKAGLEVFLNRSMPFYLATILNVLGFLLAMAVMGFGKSGPGTWGRSVWQGMMAVLGTALLIHTAAILVRMYIQGRPPVTDLYSSAVLVGWAAAATCLLIEYFSKRGFCGVVAAACGFGTLIIAHGLHLQKDGDTMGPMQAVLDSNFWLATHVVIITIGYAATFVAGLLGIVYIVMGMATPRLDRATARQLTTMVYGTVCFALLLSFVGTVLGGIWADQSWGRFWGWDPKENGAVMIVIMNAIILHAKWGKLVKERGIMVLAVGGNIITAWSWFGTNQLGVGLHAYGFTDGVLNALKIFVASQLLVMSAAMIVPTRQWWSFRRPQKKAVMAAAATAS